MVMAPPPTRDSAIQPCFHGCLAFLRRNFPPQSLLHIPLIHLSTINSSPRAGIAPQSLNSSHCAVQGMYGFGKDRLILIPLRLPQISCFPSTFNVSPLTQTIARMWGSEPCFSSPHPPRAGPVLLTLSFFPQFPHPTEFCMGLYILFCCSGSPLFSQRAFCMCFCV